VIAKELVRAAGSLLGVASHYVGHVGRGKWQDAAIDAMYKALSDPENQGRVLMLTIDMKSKTPTGKNREPQGHGFGGRGMSLQGGMVDVCLKGETRTFYCDLIYHQTSNQKVEEAMSGLGAQLECLKAQFPTVEEVWIVSDKCSNFNAFCQIPFIVEGNERNWTSASEVTHPKAKKRKVDWSEAEIARNTVDLTADAKDGSATLPDSKIAAAQIHKTEAGPSKTRTFVVAKWTFTEAQCGKVHPPPPFLCTPLFPTSPFQSAKRARFLCTGPPRLPLFLDSPGVRALAVPSSLRHGISWGHVSRFEPFHSGPPRHDCFVRRHNPQTYSTGTTI
jgi:hypothetical protein